MKAASGVISWASSTTSAQVVSSILDGDTPTALLFLSFFRDPTRDTAWVSFGAATGVGTQRSHAIYHWGGATSWAGNWIRDTAIASFASGLTARTIELTALGAGSFTLTPNDATPSNTVGRTYWVALSEVQADLRTLTLTSAGTTKQTTTWSPKAVIMGARIGSTINSQANGANGTFGMWTEQGGGTFGCNVFGLSAGTSNTGTRASRNGMPKFSLAAVDSGTIQGYVDVPTWYSDGYDVSITNVPGVNESIVAWALALDCEAALLPFTVPSSTGAQVLTGAGRRGQVAVTMLTPRVVTTDTLTDHLSFAMGMATSSVQGMVRVDVPDASASPTSAHTTAEDAITGGQTAATEDSRAAFTSFDADGVTLTWSDSDAVAGIGAVLVLGEHAASASGSPTLPLTTRLPVPRVQHVVLRNATTGLGVTGLTYNSAGLVLTYATADGLPATFTPTAPDWVELDATNAPGVYRVTWPAEAVATPQCVLRVAYTGAFASVQVAAPPLRRRTLGEVGSGTNTRYFFSLAGTDPYTAQQPVRRWLQFLTGAARGERVQVVEWGSGVVAVAPPLTQAPAAGDRFVVG